MHKCEKAFFSRKTSEGFALLPQPCIFRLTDEKGISVTYRPDFYCVEENAFYEIVGTKQAYYQNRHKYELMMKCYPNLKFIVIAPDGKAYRPDSYGIASMNEACKNHPLTQYVLNRGTTLKAFAASIPIDAGWLSRIVNGKQVCGLKTAKRLSDATCGAVPIKAFTERNLWNSCSSY